MKRFPKTLAAHRRRMNAVVYANLAWIEEMQRQLPDEYPHIEYYARELGLDHREGAHRWIKAWQPR